MERGSIFFMFYLWATTWLPGALSSRHPSAAAALVAYSPENSTLLWWQKQAPISPHCCIQPFLPKCLVLTTYSISLTQGRASFHHCCFPLLVPTEASPTKGAFCELCSEQLLVHCLPPLSPLIVCPHLHCSVLSLALSLLGPRVPLGASGAVLSPTF